MLRVPPCSWPPSAGSRWIDLFYSPVFICPLPSAEMPGLPGYHASSPSPDGKPQGTAAQLILPLGPLLLPISTPDLRAPGPGTLAADTASPAHNPLSRGRGTCVSPAQVAWNLRLQQRNGQGRRKNRGKWWGGEGRARAPAALFCGLVAAPSLHSQPLPSPGLETSCPAQQRPLPQVRRPHSTFHSFTGQRLWQQLKGFAVWPWTLSPDPPLSTRVCSPNAPGTSGQVLHL